MKLKTILIYITIFFGILGCQTMPYQPYARDVKRKPQTGGVIALKTEHRDEDRGKANNMMASNCGNSQFNIIEEGEVVVGEKTTSSTDQSYNRGTRPHQVGSVFGVPLIESQDASTRSNGEQNTVQLKEWQISYECKKSNETPLKAAQKENEESKSSKNKKTLH